MSFIQGNINSKEDLIEAMDAMRGMLTQGDYKTELELELAEVEHKLAGFNNSELFVEDYAYTGILHALKGNLESRIQKLEEADKAPQKVGYDELDDKGPQEAGYDELDDDESTQSDARQDYKKFLELYLDKTYGVPKWPLEVEEEESAEPTSEVFLEEILEKINAQTQAEVDKLRNNPWGL